MRRKAPSAVQAALQVALYGALEKCGGKTPTAVLAAELDVVASTVTRQSTGDIPVQAQTIAAMEHIDRDAALGLLRILADSMGQELRPAAWVLAAAPTMREALQYVTAEQICCSEGAGLAYSALRDGRLEPHEIAALESQWAREDDQRQATRDSLRAMAAQDSKTVPLHQAARA